MTDDVKPNRTQCRCPPVVDTNMMFLVLPAENSLSLSKSCGKYFAIMNWFFPPLAKLVIYDFKAQAKLVLNLITLSWFCSGLLNYCCFVIKLLPWQWCQLYCLALISFKFFFFFPFSILFGFGYKLFFPPYWWEISFHVCVN